MICGNCGTELDLSTKFCPECGAAVAKASVPSAIDIPSLRTSRSSNVKKTIGWLLLAAAVLVIVLIVKGTASSHKQENSARASACHDRPHPTNICSR